jgi:hypothetical protein
MTYTEWRTKQHDNLEHLYYEMLYETGMNLRKPDFTFEEFCLEMYDYTKHQEPSLRK